MKVRTLKQQIEDLIAAQKDDLALAESGEMVHSYGKVFVTEIDNADPGDYELGVKVKYFLSNSVVYCVLGLDALGYPEFVGSNRAVGNPARIDICDWFYEELGQTFTDEEKLAILVRIEYKDYSLNFALRCIAEELGGAPQDYTLGYGYTVYRNGSEISLDEMKKLVG